MGLGTQPKDRDRSGDPRLFAGQVGKVLDGLGDPR